MYLSPGKSLRLGRLFDRTSSKTVMVAMDHGQGGVRPGLENPEATLEKVIEGKPDGILLSIGMARRFQEMFSWRGAPALIISTDFVLNSVVPKGPETVEEQRVTAGVEEAVAMGADAIKVLLVFGRASAELQARNFEYVARTAEVCRKWNLPIIVEPTLWGSMVPDEKKDDPDTVVDIARISAELGADMVKAQYTGDPDSFKKVVRSCPVPVTILGGAKTNDMSELFTRIQDALAAGACGVVFGRNVWQSKNPTRTVQALRALVHSGDYNEALELLR
ncbi:MAG: fructose-1,6-bisphosphate aldolase [Firmicutes bacterium]|jgi:class I fructose-bisphosphate aldolase|nr:fructose-1,6-bisphosphate aldolase [Bacillota bacterium]